VVLYKTKRWMALNCKLLFVSENVLQQVLPCAEIEGCSPGLVLFSVIAFIVAFIAASIPCYVMCCCAHPPEVRLALV
jgi:hypothetical protein